jgi:hypothetical protein
MGYAALVVLVCLALAACGTTARPTLDVRPTQSRVAELTQVAAVLAPTAKVGTLVSPPSTVGALGGGPIGRDKNGWCQVTLPAGFTSTSIEGVWGNEEAQLGVDTVPSEGLSFTAFTQKIPSIVGGQFGYVTQSTSRYRAEFFDSSTSNRVAGTVVAVPGPSTGLNEPVFCLGLLVYPQGQEAMYRAAAETMAQTLQATRR